VRNDQEAQAREVLAAMKRGELELPDTFDAEGVRESSDSEAKEETPPASIFQPRTAVRGTSNGRLLSQTAASPIAPEEKGVLSRLLILAIGVAVTLWLWVTLTH
jgi:hypothetical protein